MTMSLRLKLFLGHLAISATIIGVSIALIVAFWYPPPFAQLEGVFTILLVMAGVDVCAGPLCTLVAASASKTRAQLKRDLLAIGTVQLIALAYAIYTVFIARPGFVVYSVGQFEVEHANELSAKELAKAKLPEFSSVPIFGPKFVEARFPDDPKESAKIITDAVMTGFDIKDMPMYYEAWPYVKTDARKNSKAIAALPADSYLRGAVSKLLAKHQVPENDAAVFPINGKIDRGTVVVRQSDLSIVGIIPFVSP